MPLTQEQIIEEVKKEKMTNLPYEDKMSGEDQIEASEEHFRKMREISKKQYAEQNEKIADKCREIFELLMDERES